MPREMTLDDLSPAKYNPRTITPVQVDALRKSYARFGDLSGIVYNQTTRNLVGGHQRVDLYRKSKNAKVVRHEHRDAIGTVAVGHILVPTEKGAIRIPYREVAWDGDTERAANIAANAAGGTFDQLKLGRVLDGLERRRFPIESIPLDTVQFKRAVRIFEYMNRQKALADTEAFQEVDVGEVRASLEHTCPRCNYKWSGVSRPAVKDTHGRRLVNGKPVTESQTSKTKSDARARTSAQAKSAAKGNRR